MEPNETVRLFTGTYADADIFRDVYDEIKGDFEGKSFGKWVEKENLHFTYHFIGDFEAGKIGNLKEKLSPILKEYDSLLEFRGLKVFPNMNRPRILNVPVYHNGILREIFDELAKELAHFGVVPDRKKYKPHITLQRIKDVERDDFREIMAKYKEREFGVMNRFKVCLIESRLTPKGPIYKVLKV